MDTQLMTLIVTAATLGTLHTLMGPDHYIPFVAISKARNWKVGRTVAITILCGLGHVLSSVVIGAIGILAGSALKHLVSIESMRGEIAAWLLTAFGLVYMIWGLRAAARNHIHSHSHHHGHEHVHDHDHEHEHENKTSLTPWVLFIVFVFGPCEPLIPLLMYPAALQTSWSVVAVAGVFGVCTISTMLVSVLLLRYGISMLPMAKLHRYSHALAGASIFICGLLIHMGL